MLERIPFLRIRNTGKQRRQDVPDPFQVSFFDITFQSKDIRSPATGRARYIFRHQTFQHSVFDFLIRESQEESSSPAIIIYDCQIPCLVKQRHWVRIVCPVIRQHRFRSIQRPVCQSPDIKSIFFQFFYQKCRRPCLEPVRTEFFFIKYF